MATSPTATSPTEAGDRLMARQHAPADPVIEARRARARRTAWVFGGIALAVYVGFLMLGVLGR